MLMNTELIGQSWDKLADKQEALTHTFQERLFELHPNYKSLFPESKSISKIMEKMVRTITLVARVDDPELVHPRMVKLGDRHRRFNLTKEDLLNVKRVLLEVLGEYCHQYCPEIWNEDCAQAWTEAFDEHIIPYMMQGLEQKMTRSERMRIINMQTSASNQLLGRVISITAEGLFAEVVLQLKGEDELAALITPKGVESLGLVEGSQAYAIIRAPHVMLMHADTGLKVSARNCFCGWITKTEIATVNAKVTLQLKSGNEFQAIVAQQTFTELELKEGERVCCVFRAIDVILAVETEPDF
jgi:molybdopterin-binding protein